MSSLTVTRARAAITSTTSATTDRPSKVNRVASGEGKTLIPPSALKCLGRPPLIKGEKLEDFTTFVEELARDLNAVSFSEWLIVCEIARLKWLSLRMRRAEAGLFDHALNSLGEMPDHQMSLGVALKKSIDTIERSSRLILDMDRRCDVLMRNLRRLQEQGNPGPRRTIELEAEEVVNDE